MDKYLKIVFEIHIKIYMQYGYLPLAVVSRMLCDIAADMPTRAFTEETMKSR